jgi:hypothetical protein
MMYQSVLFSEYSGEMIMRHSKAIPVVIIINYSLYPADCH